MAQTIDGNQDVQAASLAARAQRRTEGQEGRIRALSLSVGWGPDEASYDEITAITREAKEAGLLVVSSSIDQTYGFQINGLGRAALADPGS